NLLIHYRSLIGSSQFIQTDYSSLIGSSQFDQHIYIQNCCFGQFNLLIYCRYLLVNPNLTAHLIHYRSLIGSSQFDRPSNTLQVTYWFIPIRP
ncbi:hypothetical protein GIB67_025326, partial [Kingdonia uniflora]